MVRLGSATTVSIASNTITPTITTATVANDTLTASYTVESSLADTNSLASSNWVLLLLLLV